MKKNYLKEKAVMSTTKNKLRFVRFLYFFIFYLRKILRLPTQNILINRKGLSWKIDLNEAIDFCLFISGDYEPELIDAYTPLIKDQNYTIIDIGANIGAHTLYFAKLTGAKGRILAIEPTSFAFKKLQTNISHNPKVSKKVEAYQVLLTNPLAQIGVENISSSWNIGEKITSQQRNPFDGGFSKSTEKALKLTLDQFVEKHNLDKIDLIKLDVDGNEIDILKGAKETFKKFQPILLVELSPIHFDNPNQPYTFSDQVTQLKELNYDFHDIFGKKIDLDTDILQRKIPHGTLINIIGKPSKTV